MEVLVLFLINNAILRRRKKLLLYLQRYLSHIELHIQFFPCSAWKRHTLYIPIVRRKFLNWLIPCERTNHVCSGSRTKR